MKLKSLFLLVSLISCLFCMNTAFAVSKKKITTDNWHQATSQVVHQYGKKADRSLIPYFKRAKVDYPPKEVALLTFKKEKTLELWAKDANKVWTRVRNYKLTAESGGPGPKLKVHDKQIPEGIYNITHVNPFSKFHLSMMIDYPNQFDRTHAKRDGRTNLGKHIFIHGKNSSVGCIAIGDKAISELFVLVNHIGVKNTQVVIAPHDLRHKEIGIKMNKKQPRWLPELYALLHKHLQTFTV